MVKMHTTKEGSQVSCLAQRELAAFGKGMQPISEAVQPTQLTSQCGVLATAS